MRGRVKPFSCGLLAVFLAVQLGGCAARTESVDLIASVSPAAVEGKPVDEPFRLALADFGVRLLQELEEPGKNLLISPLSAELALTMAANGAAGETRTEMEAVLSGGIAVEDWNRYLYGYTRSLPSTQMCKLEFANSIWFRDRKADLTVEPSFLECCAAFYDAAVYKAPFDRQTVEEMNRWISEYTEGRIDKVIEDIPDEARLYLLNALAFDGNWLVPYLERRVEDGTFTTADGTEQTVTMMSGEERRYLETEQATGFLRPYDGGYSFGALLPREGTSLEELLTEMTGEELLAALDGARKAEVWAVIPKFSCRYSAQLEQPLARLGMPMAFTDQADFSQMGSSKDGPLTIGEVRHETSISVDEQGTQSAAMTAVMLTPGAAVGVERYVVRLDRPFLYFIVDDTANLPVFLGIVASVSETG